jgi:hypothetical protein
MKLALFLSAVVVMPFGLIGCSEESGSASAPPPTEWSGQAQTSPAPAHGAMTPAGGELRVGDLAFTVPEGWASQPPSNSMREAELHVPDPSGDASRNCVAAFSFAGGDVDANITRWIGQFSNPAGGEIPVTRETRTVAGRAVHLVEMSGNYAGMGMGPVQADQMMRAAIVERPGEPHLFIKMTGPRERMAGVLDGWNALIDSMR